MNVAGYVGALVIAYIGGGMTTIGLFPFSAGSPPRVALILSGLSLMVGAVISVARLT